MFDFCFMASSATLYRFFESSSTCLNHSVLYSSISFEIYGIFEISEIIEISEILDISEILEILRYLRYL